VVTSTVFHLKSLVQTSLDLAQTVFRYCVGPYRKHGGHMKRSAGAQDAAWPWWFRYGAMKEASPGWHETAMRFESVVVVGGTVR
jgi:hypothetical protein